MTAGDQLRAKMKRNDAALLPALTALLAKRAELTGDQSGRTWSDNTAYLLDSLKTPEEIAVLRSIYGPRVVVIAAYAPRTARVEELVEQINRDTLAQREDSDARSKAEHIVRRDEIGQQDDPYGQNVGGAFPHADLIVATKDDADVRYQVQRFIDLVFGSLEHTPTRMEQGMYLAKTAALRSSAMSRQVGAAILTEDGQVLSLGTNEAPKPGGGAYWSDAEPDNRTFSLESDPSVLMRDRLMANLMMNLKRAGWHVPENVQQSEDTDQLIKEALDAFRQWEADQRSSGKTVTVLAEDIIEFYREVHGEMMAITDAARRGVSLQDQRLFTTTFPCHDCAKHIVASGLAGVIFLEPYPKSLVKELHPDAIRIDGEGSPELRKVDFDTFVGVAPRRYASFFQSGRRPKKGTFDRSTSKMRLGEYEDPGLNVDLEWYDPHASIRREELVLGDLKRTFERATGEQLQ